jgi:(E)-4-hydroxy-3-methylbut-2-enyl-diphosphate synthase
VSEDFKHTIVRRKTKMIDVGNVKVGGNAKITVQSMTNTLTTDIEATVSQINSLVEEGADIVRVSCPDKESTKSLKEVVNQSSVPIVADIHFHYKRAIEAAEAGAACLRVNPGNIGKEKIIEVIEAAKQNNISMRVGVNAGSIDEKILIKYKEPCSDALVESALENIKLLEDNNFENFKISVKASDVFITIESYEKLAQLCDYPFHVGLTEAGTYLSGSIKSSISIGTLLSKGIGDTIRVSLTADPVEGIKIISCPSCARQAFPVIETVKKLEQRLAHIKTPLTLSIIGCVVNGPGEALKSDIGLTGGGKGNNMIYLSGVADHKITNPEIVDHVVELVEQKVRTIND